MGLGLKKMLLGVAVAGALAMGGVAQAAPIDFTTLFAFGPTPAGTINTVTDANGDNLIKAPGNTLAGKIEVGDWIAGVYDYKRISNVSNPFPGTAIGAGTGYTEMTGLVLTKVTGKVANAGGGFNFTFGADAAKFSSVFSVGAVPVGTVTALYDDASQDFTLSGSVAASITSAKNGTLAGHAGFTGAGGAPKPGEGWTVIGASDDFAALTTVDTSFTLGTANFALNRTDTTGYFGGLVIVGQPNGFNGGGLAEFLGSSTLKGSLGAGVAWDAVSQTNLQFVAAVPLPTSAWMGLSAMALMGAGYAVRKLRTPAL